MPYIPPLGILIMTYFLVQVLGKVVHEIGSSPVTTDVRTRGQGLRTRPELSDESETPALNNWGGGGPESWVGTSK